MARIVILRGMKILSVDIGIRNLALCLLETGQAGEGIQIARWSVLDLAPPRACATCPRPATVAKGELVACRVCAKKHAPDLLLVTPKMRSACTPPHDENYLRKAGCLRDGEKCTQAAVRRFLRERAFLPYKSPPASSIPLPRVAAALGAGIDAFLERAGRPLDSVAIENQIGPQAIRMKAVQAMVTQHVVTTGLCGAKGIVYMSAGEKLRAFASSSNKKLTYGQRKQLGIRACEHVLKCSGETERLGEFASHPKRDDLADAYLQGVAFAVGAGRAVAPPGWGSPDVRIT